MARQSSDGAWRSANYHVLSSGRILTPFVLFALAQVPATRHRDAIARALARAEDGVDEAYPTYSRALWILALAHHRPAGWEARVKKLERELRESQLVEALGWSPSDPEYGAWDMGVRPARKPEVQRPDVSMTAFAVEALRAAGAVESDAALAAAARFASSVSQADGGAIFTPNVAWAHQNKAGPGRSYGTATADALRIRRDARALAWLNERFRADAAPGFPAEGDRWDAALQYYWLFAAARVGVRGAEIRARLAATQQKDGSWVNALGLMKEDDPIVATGLGLAAWGFAK